MARKTREGLYRRAGDAGFNASVRQRAGPACYPDGAGRLSEHQQFIIPGGRLYEQRNRAWELINDIPGVSCVKPKGALYMFPKIDAKRFNIHDDQKMVLDFLLQEKVLLVQGTAFNWPWPDHVRIVTLPRANDLEMAISRFGRCLSGYHQL